LEGTERKRPHAVDNSFVLWALVKGGCLT
jgi:hypothetical protein